MKKAFLLAIVGCICLLCACNERILKQEIISVKVVAHSLPREEGSGIASKTSYEFWVYENTETKERLLSTRKYGEIGEVFKLDRKALSVE